MTPTTTRALLDAGKKVIPIMPICSDHDDECPDVPNKVRCWLYDPARGMCPFLRGEQC